MALPELETKAASLNLSNGTHAAAEPFGNTMLKHFGFSKGYRNLNHGSFGTHPMPVRDAQHSFQVMAEENPDRFQRYDQVKYLNAARTELAALVKCPVSSLVMIPNVTTGIHTVLRNLTYNEGDVIVYGSCTYGACQKIVLSTAEVTPATAHRIPFSYPLSDDELVGLYRDAIADLRSSGKNPRVVVFDTIHSMPGLRMPYERLVAMCKELGVISVVDGAHGIGHIPLDLARLDPDYFVSNCHKWLYTPRGCAILYVPERNQATLRTTFPTSHYFVPSEAVGGGHAVSNPLVPMSGDDTPFTKLFEYVGTLDLSPYLVVPAALKFRREVCGGEERIMKYSSDLASAAGVLAAKKLGTEVLDNPEGTMTRECAMINVRLPLVAPEEFRTDAGGRPLPAQSNGDDAGQPVDFDEGGPDAVCKFIERLLVDDFNTFIPIPFYLGSWWARFSGQVYLDMDDIEFGADALVKACERVRAGEHLKKTKV